jgi:hypothetical protein
MFTSEHKLDFEVAEWITRDFRRFRIGTCEGLWRATSFSYDILAVENTELGNGHFNDVLQWFEHSATRDNRKFRILETWNTRLKHHLIEKRGFIDIGNDNLEKSFP